ncbi:hypothetical protein ACKVWH_000348, partial [Pyricularia oryzae]
HAFKLLLYDRGIDPGKVERGNKAQSICVPIEGSAPEDRLPFASELEGMIRPGPSEQLLG